jgi:peroxiredoxin
MGYDAWCPRLHTPKLRFPRFASAICRPRVTVAGLSTQTTEAQTEAVTRLRLPFPLLADSELHLASALGLPTLSFAGMTFYKRLTLIADRGRIVKVFYPVFPPHENAAEVKRWLDERTTS